MGFVNVGVIVGMVSGVVLKRLGGSGGEAGIFISCILLMGFGIGTGDLRPEDVDVICGEGFEWIFVCTVVIICGILLDFVLRSFELESFELKLESFELASFK